MHTIIKRLNPWLNLWLILALVGNLLSPIAPAFASPAASNSTQLVAADKEASLSGVTDEKGVWPTVGEETTPASIATPRTFPLPFPTPSSLSLRPEVTKDSTKPSELIQATQAITPSGLMFIENVGQFETKARFIVRNGLETLYLTDNALWFSILEQTKPPTQALKTGHDPFARNSRRPQPKKGVNLKLTFPGANPHARIEPFDPLDTRISSFIGNDPAHWRSDVPVWGGVRYVDFYPGADLEITGQQGKLALRLALHQSAPQAVEAQRMRGAASFGAQVRLRVEGAKALALEADTVRLTTTVADFSLPLMTLVTAEGAPMELPDTQPDLKGREITAPFAPPETAAARPLSTPHLAYPLLLAPVSQSAPRSDVLYGTYLGFNFWDDSDSQGGITLDNAGNVYVVMRIYGVTSDLATPGAYDPTVDAVGGDLYIAKLRLDGNGAANLLYATFLGGTGGDWDAGIAVDSAGDIYVTGYTTSLDFPMMNPYQPTAGGDGDAFVARLRPAGAGSADLLYSTYLGKASNERGFDLTVRANSQGQPIIYLFGVTESANFQTTLNAYDTTHNGRGTGFVAKLNPTSPWQTQLEYSTFLGRVGYDSTAAGEIAVDNAGDIYIAGQAESDTFTPTAGTVDSTFEGWTEAFLVKLRPAGAVSADLLYSTYLGGSGFDAAYSLAIDPAGNAYLGGEASADFPLSAGAYDSTYAGISDDGFVAKIRPDSSATNNLLYSTYLGGDGYGFDFVSGIGVDTSGKIYAVGYTEATNFPTTANAAQPILDTVAYQDGFVTKLDPAVSGQWGLLYSSYLGGTGEDYFFDLAVDPAGNAYVVGGTWASDDLPTTNGAYDTTYNGSGSGYVAKLKLGMGNDEVIRIVEPQNDAQLAWLQPLTIKVQVNDGNSNYQTYQVKATLTYLNTIDPTTNQPREEELFLTATGHTDSAWDDYETTWSMMYPGQVNIIAEVTVGGAQAFDFVDVNVACPPVDHPSSPLPDLSPIGQAVNRVVQAVPCGGNLPDDWFITMPPTEQAIARFGDLAREAKYEVDFTTYIWERGTQGTAGFVEGLKDLYEAVKADAQNNNGQGYPQGMTVRILIGGFSERLGGPTTLGDQRANVLADLADQGIPLEEDSYWKVEVGMYRTVNVETGDKGKIYSHVKMMVVDGAKTIVAGYNMLSEAWFSFYDGTYDVGIQLEGGGVGQAAQAVFDRLWLGAWLCTEAVIDVDFQACTEEDGIVSSISHVAEVLSIGPYTGNEINVFSLYRDEVDKMADGATEQAISASTDIVNVFQDRVEYTPSKEVPAYVTGIVNALQNNSNVRILAACNLRECFENATSATNIEDYIEKISPALLNNFEYRPFIPRPGPFMGLARQPMPGLHAKVTSIDNQFLIIGSQNFDYSAFGNTPEDEDLVEYSIGIDDGPTTDIFDAYFDERWNTQSVEVAQVDGSIQNAVAQAEPDTLVVIPEGVYNETIIVDKPVTLLGLNGSKVIVEPSEEGDPAFRVTSSGVSIYNLTVQNSSGYGIELIDNTSNNSTFAP